VSCSSKNEDDMIADYMQSAFEKEGLQEDFHDDGIISNTFETLYDETDVTNIYEDQTVSIQSLLLDHHELNSFESQDSKILYNRSI
jgi:hypothetical protein